MSLSRAKAWTLAGAMLLFGGLLGACGTPAAAPPDPPSPLDSALAPVADSAVAPTSDMATPPQAIPDLALPAAAPDLASNVPPSASGPVDPLLASRSLDYSLALRTASLKLVGDLPTSDDLYALSTAQDPAQAYKQRVSTYFSDPRFATQMITFFRNTFRTGGSLPGLPSQETAATFAARLVVEGQPFTNVVTAPANTCPTFANGTFTDGDCKNGVGTAAGVLTDPGIQAHFYSNMAFRRTRWVQETFICRKFPAESIPPVMKNGGLYSSPWPFESITGGMGSPINFLDTSSVVCANCHSTMNHIAPLFANFDATGKWQGAIQVTTPVNGLPKTVMSDWLPQGEMTSWRFGVAAADLPSLGSAIAADPDFAGCVATRIYDWAMSKDDVVTDNATVPDDVIGPYRTDLVANQFSVKSTILKAFTSDDFVRF